MGVNTVTMLPREPLPTRRRTWRQKGRIEGVSFLVEFGEYPDGRLGEVWIEAKLEGTTIRGLLGALARVISISLQSGVPASTVVHSLQGMCFPPAGEVRGEGAASSCSSIADWVAQEIERVYVKGGAR